MCSIELHQESVTAPVWLGRLDIPPIFYENVLSLWDADCDDLFSTCQFPTVWRGCLKEQLKWSKRCFRCHLLNRLFCRLNIITEKKAKEGGIAVVWRGDRGWGRRKGFLAHYSSSNPSGKDSSVHRFSVISPCPGHSLTTEILLWKSKLFQRCRSTNACMDIWGFMRGKLWEKNPPWAIANMLQVAVFSLAVVFFLL